MNQLLGGGLLYLRSLPNNTIVPRALEYPVRYLYGGLSIDTRLIPYSPAAAVNNVTEENSILPR